MKKYKVLYLINYAPNYRDKFLQELGKHVDLTVTSFPGEEANMKDPEIREGYRYIQLKSIKFLKFNLNFREYTTANGDYDVIIVGYTLWSIFRMLNIFRPKKRVICEGLLYGTHNNFITSFLRKIHLNASEGILVYSNSVKEKVLKSLPHKEVISFNNTSFFKDDMIPQPFNKNEDGLNILWVGRDRKGRNLKQLIDLAERNPNVNVRIIGIGLYEKYHRFNDTIVNFEVLGPIFGDDLIEHYKWCHAVFNPGGAGLIVMNTARFARPIIIDKNSYHGPEIDLAKEADQIFIDFTDENKIDNLIKQFIIDKSILEDMGAKMYDKMHNYTIENMVNKYLMGIENRWHENI